MTTVRGFVVPNFVLRPGGVRSDDDDCQEETFAQAKEILEMRSSSDAGSFRAFSSSDNTPSALLNRSHALPSRMAETFGKPESVRDVFVTRPNREILRPPWP